MKLNIKTAIKAMRTNTSKPERQGEYWSEDEIENLKSMFYSEYGITEMALTLQRTEPAIFQQIEKLDLFDRKENPRRQRVARQLNCLCGRCGNDPALCPLRKQCTAKKEN